MQQLKTASNPQETLTEILQHNPNTSSIANILHSNGNLEWIARMMANTNGIDINQLIRNL